VRAIDRRRYNRRSLRRIDGPIGEAVTLAEARAWIVDPPAGDNALIVDLITAATDMVERYLAVSLLEQTLELRLDGFPGDADENLLALGPGVHTASLSFVLSGTGEIELPAGPIQSVESIVATMRDNSTVTVDPATYSLDGEGWRVFLNDGQVWPVDLRARDAVRVQYVAGYGAGNIPAPILQAIKQHIAVMYEHRGGCELGGGVQALLDPYKRVDLLMWS
jgi:hypothetical protein